ncbi:MAG: hypothetical protein ACFB13_00895 [Kiloniellaceae bacterium]
MNRLRRNGEWSVVLFVVALLAFNPPVLSIFSVPELILGIPILYLYIFAAWAGVIALLAFNVSGLVDAENPPPLRIPGPPPESLSARSPQADDDDGVGDGSGHERHPPEGTR